MPSCKEPCPAALAVRFAPRHPVAACVGSGLVYPWAALLIGTVAGGVYEATSEAMLAARLDDVVNAVAIHCTPGIWGALAVGFFAVPKLIRATYLIPCASSSTSELLLLPPPPCLTGVA